MTNDLSQRFHWMIEIYPATRLSKHTYTRRYKCSTV